MAGLDVRAIDAAGIAAERFPTDAHEFRVFVSQEAFDRLTTRGAADLTREVGGVLVGRLCRDEGGSYVRVDTVIDALHAEEKGAELTFTHATWDHVNREMDARHVGLSIVGWYHTHPGFGVFLSDRDQFIQRSFFNLPFQVALVFDPKSREHGVFAWRDNEPARVRRHWVGDREHVWDGVHPTTAAAATRPAEKEREMALDTVRAEPAGADPLGIAMAAALLIALGGFGGWWMGQRGVAEVAAQAEARAARGVAESLDAELLATMRRALDDPARRMQVDAALADIDASSKALAGAGEAAQKEAIARLDAARASIGRARDDQERAARVMRYFEESARTARLDPQAVRRVLDEHGALLGEICATFADMAARSGDPEKARLLLEQGARIDPSREPAYRARIAELQKGAPK